MRRDILTVSSQQSYIECSKNELSFVRNKNITKKGARVFQDNKLFSSSYVGEIDNSELFERALQNKQGATSYDYELLEGIESQSKKDLLQEKTKEDLFENFEKALLYLKKNHPQFNFLGNATWNRVNKSLHLDESSKLEYEYDFCNFFLKYRKNSSENHGEGYLTGSSFDMESLVKKHSAFLEVHENKISIKEGRWPVVFALPSNIISLGIYRAQSFQADSYKKGVGLFKGKLGEKILSDKLSFLDVSYDPEILAMDFFDGEGFVREEPELFLIRDGVFENFICDLRYAKKYNLKPTGNSRRSFDTASSLDFNTLCVKRAKRSTQNILKSLPDCIFAETSFGGDFTSRGDFSAPVQTGFLIQNGEVKGRLPQITVKSSLEKMLGSDLIEIGSDSFCPSSQDPHPSLFMNMDVFLN